MKDLQILWAAFKYHWRRFTSIFKEDVILQDDKGNYYRSGCKTSMQRVLYWRAYQEWQKKRFERRQLNVGEDLFESDTHIKKH